MKLTQSLLIGVLCIGASPVYAQEEKKDHTGVKQPWSAYKVHDVNRPHPPKVSAPGCVRTKAPEGAVVLFDGQDFSAFKGGWEVKDGVVRANASGGVRTKEAFGSCHLHIEWRVPSPHEVNGQKGGNSGVFLMGRYELQIQESHTNVTYADGQAAAIYGQTPPQVNASLPQGEWNSYDILFEAPEYGEKGLIKKAYMTVVHNGVVVHSRQLVYGPTLHKKVATYPETHPKTAPLRLQWHNDPVEFRNIWIQPLSEE